MKDYRIQISIKNNHLISMMEGFGIKTAAELYRQSGVHQTIIGDALSLKIPAYLQNGKMSAATSRLCEFFACEPCDIYPDQHLHESLPINKTFIEANAEDLIPASARLGSEDPLTLLIGDGGLANAVHLAVESLTQREQQIISARYGEKVATLRELGEKMGICVERVRHIEARALRKMRHPTRADALREFL